MLKCLDCGHIFEEGEEAVTKEYHDEIDGGFYEEFKSCPVCGGDFEETRSCKCCGGAFLEDELCCGYCEECLKELTTPDNFLAFAEDADRHLEESDLHTVEHFMLVWIYGVSDKAVIGSSKSFRALLIDQFKRAAKTHNMATQLWQYMEDYNMLDGFAEYLYDKEVRV